ncbi:MAG: hypothetical protein IPI57_13550, partial [Candidatus Competibacteraceae bacterium]|nr:hypothetical protein [Candidatus Competibacteraceae bacterium]
PATELLFGRLGAYWRMLGVTDPAQVAALSEQALRRANELTDQPDSIRWGARCWPPASCWATGWPRH